MELHKVNEKYAPSFISGIMTAILISIILGYTPVETFGIMLILIIVALYLFGLVLTWFLLKDYN